MYYTVLVLEFQEKRKVKRLIYSKITLLILAVIVLLLLKSVWGVYEKARVTRDNLNRVAEDLANLESREAKLSAEIDHLKTEGGAEEEIRAKYGLVKPGEEVIVVVKKNDNDDSASVSSSPSFWQKILDWLK